MKTYFRSHHCERCEKGYDPTFPVCPACGEPNGSLRDIHAFDHHVHEIIPFQITYVLIQTIGLFVIGFVLTIAVEIGFFSFHPGATADEALAYMQSVGVNFGLNSAGYLAVTIAFALIFAIRKRFGELFRSFRKWQNYIFGIVGGGLIVLFTYLYGLALTGIFNAAGIPQPGPNHNELLVREMVRAFPVLSILVFGVVGPMTEEIGYRVGLFGFGSRLGKWVAYLISALIFALVHFDSTALGSGDNARIIVEFANLPSYIGAGLFLGFLYDRFGLATSYTAHVVNNLVSLVTTLAGGQ